MTPTFANAYLYVCERAAARYVIAGSDTGRAVVYERDTGVVVGLLAADSTICNVVLVRARVCLRLRALP